MMKTHDIRVYIYNFLSNHGAEIEYDVFSYGFSTLINYFYYVIITLPIIMFLEKGLETLMFLIFFIPLRRFIGGYHFKSKILCLIFSVFFSIFIPYLAIWIGRIRFAGRIIPLIIVMILTYVVKAVDHPNKRLSIKEKAFYTKKTLTIEILYSLLIIFIYNQFTYLYLNIAYLSLLFCTIGILIARFKTLSYNI